MDCTCGTTKETTEAILSTVDLSAIASFQIAAQTALATTFAPAAATVRGINILAGAPVPRGLTSELHVTPSGDALTSTSFAQGNEGHVVLKGSIGPIPYELHIHIKLEGNEVVVTLELKQPIPLGPFTWRFKLGGVVTNDKGEIIGASSITTVDFTPASGVAALGLNWWCVLKCGGLVSFKTLVLCLPALSGGIPGYVACVTAKAGQGAAEIAVCIATKCV